MESHAPTALIYPWVKKIVSALSAVGLLLCIISCLALLAGLIISSLLGPSHTSLLLILISFSTNTFFVCILGALLPWCHYVLLSGSGEGLTRILSLLSLIMSILLAIAMGYTILTSKPLFESQLDAPYYILALCLTSSIINLGHMKALPLRYKWRIPVGIFLLILNTFFFETGLFLFATLMLILEIYCFYPLLRGLQWLAPRVLSLPEKRQDPPPASFK